METAMKVQDININEKQIITKPKEVNYDVNKG